MAKEVRVEVNEESVASRPTSGIAGGGGEEEGDDDDDEMRDE